MEIKSLKIMYSHTRKSVFLERHTLLFTDKKIIIILY